MINWSESALSLALAQGGLRRTLTHAPAGATELHLVTELAGVFWRKRRLRLAEAATFQRGLQAAADNSSRTIRAALVTCSDASTGAMDIKRTVGEGDTDPEQALAAHEWLWSAEWWLPDPCETGCLPPMQRPDRY